MKLLMHICCAPCFSYPYFELKEQKDIELEGYFYNPNIQPEAEFNNRLDSLKRFAGENNINIYTVSWSRGAAMSREDSRMELKPTGDSPRASLGTVPLAEGKGHTIISGGFNHRKDPAPSAYNSEGVEQASCYNCYERRLRKTAQKAVEKNADAFSTTLLISPYQKHDIIIEICNRFAKEYGIDFYYKDWRPFYRKGVEISKEQKLYRQKYCGCFYSIKN